MYIGLVTPAPPYSRNGNRVTANRWAGILRSLGHRVTISQTYNGQDFDLLVAIHALRSAEAVVAFKARRPANPIVVLLAGTDVYGPLYEEGGGPVLDAADRLVTLQRLAVDELRPEHKDKVRTIVQSARPTPTSGPSPNARHFDVTVVGHLRPVKDPFLTAEATRRLPRESRIRVLQLGDSMGSAMTRRASAFAARNSRYTWIRGLPAWRARRLLKRSQVMVISSLSEGGANVVSEAAVDGVPILASRMPGNVGLLGDDYPGYFPVGDSSELRRLLLCCETDPTFLTHLREAEAPLRSLLDPQHECADWAALLDEIALGVS
ncbi:MAG: selenoneine biosynthesis selenosugar synthase SenB [Chloroflexi bacterium]|nr:selenoneine biosynthesis selenosugar synthase SenB [Chloroflexota bacterium]